MELLKKDEISMSCFSVVNYGGDADFYVLGFCSFLGHYCVITCPLVYDCFCTCKVSILSLPCLCSPVSFNKVWRGTVQYNWRTYFSHALVRCVILPFQKLLHCRSQRLVYLTNCRESVRFDMRNYVTGQVVLERMKAHVRRGRLIWFEDCVLRRS